jgi:hypothetical protein
LTGGLEPVLGRLGEREQRLFASDCAERVFEQVGPESTELPFVIERHRTYVVFHYGSAVRLEVVPVFGRIAMSMGLNASAL